MALKDRWNLVELGDLNEELQNFSNIEQKLAKEYSKFVPAYLELARGCGISLGVGALSQSPVLAFLTAGSYMGKTYEGMRDTPYSLKIVEGYNEGLNNESSGELSDFARNLGRESKKFETWGKRILE